MNCTDYDLIYIPLSSTLSQVQFPHWDSNTDLEKKFLNLTSASYKPQQQKLKLDFTPSPQFQNIDSESNPSITFESKKKNLKGNHLFCIPNHSTKQIFAFSLGPAHEMRSTLSTSHSLSTTSSLPETSLSNEFTEISKRKDFKRFLDHKLKSHSFQSRLLSEEPFTKMEVSLSSSLESTIKDFSSNSTKNSSNQNEKNQKATPLNYLSSKEYTHNLLM